MTVLSPLLMHWRYHSLELSYVYRLLGNENINYTDVVMCAMASQITSLKIVYSTVYSGADQRKHQISASLAFVHKGPVTREIFPFDDVIIIARKYQ